MGLASTALAVPILQLDIPGGQYNQSDETTYATGDIFTLRALYTGGAPAGTKFYLSAAIVPQTDGGVDFGSFIFNHKTYDFNSANVQYGTPPSEELYPDLGSHGIFPTVYAEFEFEFDAIVPISFHPYNVQSGEEVSGDMDVQQFEVNISGLNEGLALHFDLYDVDVKKGKKSEGDKIGFAPFSHDAQSLVVNKTGNSTIPVPDASTSATLLGLAMMGLGLAQRRLKK